jgi:fumarate reductase subunit D
LALLLILRSGSPKLWLLFGASAGLGLLNKPSMTFFLVALLLALLVTPQRRLLASRWAALGVLLLLAIATPNLLWQIHNHWPTLEFLRNDKAGNKSIQLAPVAFLLQQILNLNPGTALIWIPGLLYLLRRRAGSNEGASVIEMDRRWLGLTYLLFLALMMALHAKDYYVSPIYPILFAAGGVAWERRFAQSRRVLDGRAFAFPIYETVLLVSAILILPLTLPLLPPAQWVRYTHATGLAHFTGNSETYYSGPLPQFFADRFGWQEEVDLVTRAYNSLPTEQRRITGILCSNYGQASAINFLGRGLPVAISRHNNYYLWGPHGYSFDSMILIEHTTPEHLHAFYKSVTVIGHMDSPWAMPFERRNTIYLLQGLKVPATAIWNPQERVYF